MTDTRWSMVSLVIMETWQQFGSATHNYMPALVGIPRDWYEAAEIDGASVWQRIRHITLPSVRGLVGLMLVMQLIATSQAFQSQLAMLDGGPNNATLTYGLHIIKEAQNRLDYGTASALGVLMFLALVFLAMLQYRFQGREGSRS
jgi:multiple sugar transport system permease protein